MGRARSLLFIVPFFAIAAVSFLAFSSFAQIPENIYPFGLGEASAYEWYQTTPETADPYKVTVGNNFALVAIPTYVPYYVDNTYQNIYIPVVFKWRIKEYASGDDGLWSDQFYASAFRILVGIKVLNVETGQYVPAEVLEKYVGEIMVHEIPQEKTVKVYAGGGSKINSLGEYTPYFEVGLVTTEKIYSGDLGIQIYDPPNNKYYKWLWDGFVMIGRWFKPHIGSVEYNFTWPPWSVTPSGYLECTTYITIVMKPLPFMLEGQPARLLVYILPEFEWKCQYILGHPIYVEKSVLRAGTGFILGDCYAFHGSICVYGKDSAGHQFEYVNTYGGEDSYAKFVPKKPP